MQRLHQGAAVWYCSDFSGVDEGASALKVLRCNVVHLFTSEANPVLREELKKRHPECRNFYCGATLGDIWKLKCELPPSGYGHLVYTAAVTDDKDLPRCCEVIDELRPDAYVICSANDMVMQRFAFQALPQCTYFSAYETDFCTVDQLGLTCVGVKRLDRPKNPHAMPWNHQLKVAEGGANATEMWMKVFEWLLPAINA